MNSITANDLKRYGISNIESMLANGPVHITKRNQSVCVVLKESDYRQLTQYREIRDSQPHHTVMTWFDLPPLGTSQRSELDRHIDLERTTWDRA